MEIQHAFTHRKVEMSDNSELWEVITEGGDRVATASTEDSILDVAMALDLCLTKCCEQNGDIVANTALDRALDA